MTGWGPPISPQVWAWPWNVPPGPPGWGWPWGWGPPRWAGWTGWAGWLGWPGWVTPPWWPSIGPPAIPWRGKHRRKDKWHHKGRDRRRDDKIRTATIATRPPRSPLDGEFWFDDATERLSIYDKKRGWRLAGVEEAPRDHRTYARHNGVWTMAPGVVDIGPSPPRDPVPGTLWWDGTQMRFFDRGAWIPTVSGLVSLSGDVEGGAQMVGGPAMWPPGPRPEEQFLRVSGGNISGDLAVAGEARVGRLVVEHEDGGSPPYQHPPEELSPGYAHP